MSEEDRGSHSLHSIESLSVDVIGKGDWESDGAMLSDVVPENDVPVDASQCMANGRKDDVGLDNDESLVIGVDAIEMDEAIDEAASPNSHVDTSAKDEEKDEATSPYGGVDTSAKDELQDEAASSYSGGGSSAKDEAEDEATLPYSDVDTSDKDEGEDEASLSYGGVDMSAKDEAALPFPYSGVDTSDKDEEEDEAASPYNGLDTSDKEEGKDEVAVTHGGMDTASKDEAASLYDVMDTSTKDETTWPHRGVDTSANDEAAWPHSVVDTSANEEAASLHSDVDTSAKDEENGEAGLLYGGVDTSTKDEAASPHSGVDMSAKDEENGEAGLLYGGVDTSTKDETASPHGGAETSTKDEAKDEVVVLYGSVDTSAKDGAKYEATLGDDIDYDKETGAPMQLHKQSHDNSKWSDTTLDTSKKILNSWFQLPDGNWELATIIKTFENESLISYSEGKVLKVDSKILLPANPDILDGVDDLMQLSYLNEPSILYNLQYRYNQDMIYTKAGPVLVAINPLKQVPLYGNDYIEAYKRKSMDKPHVYGITDTAISEMIRDEVSQSIIISGESGSGKTETAKIAMQYLAALGGGSGIEYEILKTNPILEAFANAKTLRNDNSSRFGKLIEIHFSETGKISGANIQTCKNRSTITIVGQIIRYECKRLLFYEQSRVVQCSEGERSYHIFYQLCAGAPPSLREKLNLKNVDEFKYLRQSNCYSIPGVDDAKQFDIVVEALDIVHVTKEDQDNVFAMLGAVLWLGNLSFTVVDAEDHVEPVVDEGLITVSALIGCTDEELKRALSTRKMKVGKRNDTIVQKLTLAQAIDARDALAKSIYSGLFDWLVEQINKSLAVGKRLTGRSISILDVYGFETFERNGFEQFCINYANERLQQHFNRHLFKLEQEEYIQDGIDWTKVDFEDNQDCLNLFEKKPLGLQSLLDEESTFPNGTDLSFANKLKQHVSHPCFRGERGEAFTVRHFAGEVTYHTTGFLEKNRDLLHLDSIELLSSCTCDLPRTFGSTMLTQPGKPVVGALHKSGGADSQKLSVMTKFKGQLFQLLHRLENTTPHFIRCIKPSNSQSPGSYNQGLILQQLRCCGVLEVLRISRAGFPTKMAHPKFARRYGFLLLEHVASKDPLSVSVAILNQFNILPEMYQVGYTKLFFRTGQIGALEDTRNRTLYGILRVQSCFRGHQARCLLRKIKGWIAFLQSFIRAEKTRKAYAILLRDHRAAIAIQKRVKARTIRRSFNRLTEASTAIQAVIRGWMVRSCSGDVELLQYLQRMVNQPEEILVKYSYLAELQCRVLRAEKSAREKEEENEIIHHRLQEYEDRWSEYEMKMKAMEEVWQKQMRSLQSSLSIAKSFGFDVSHRNSDAPVNGNNESESSWDAGNHTKPHESNVGKPTNPSFNVISRLAEEFEQRSQVFGDDARFLVEVKSGQVEANLDPDEELRRLKQMFEAWKKDFGARLREAKVIIHKLGNSEGQSDKARKKWWGRRNSSRYN